MKPAIFTSFDSTIPFSQAIQMIRQAGFEVVALGGNRQNSGYITKEQRTATCKLIKENGMSIDSLHAPFPEGDRLFSLNEAERLESIIQCKNALDAAAELDGKIVVIHLIQPYGIPVGEVRNKMIDQGRRSVGTLAEHADIRGIKLALENGQKSAYDQILKDFLDEFKDKHIGFCYDTGHENVQGTCFSMLEQLGNRLFTMHIHDNTGSDSHMLPFEGTIDWNHFKNILRNLNYSGNILIEAHSEHSEFKESNIFLAEAIKRAQKLF